MKFIKLLEQKQLRVGIIPYYFENSRLYIQLMIPSDIAYGGRGPQMAKGRVDVGESTLAAATREGGEELGLKQSNIKSISHLKAFNITGLTVNYVLEVYLVEVKNKKDFNKPHYETKSARFYEYNDAVKKVRSNQRNIILEVGKKLLSK